MGLGLGYNEFVVAEEALIRGVPQVFLRSFEIESELKSNLLEFVLSGGVPQNSAQEIYLSILNRFVLGKEIPSYLASLAKNGSWRMDGGLDAATSFPQRANAILFDAFSSKTSPDLWTEEFLMAFLDVASAPEFCQVSTYACTGALKRCLVARGFKIILREGFHGKRNSTLGLREPR